VAVSGSGRARASLSSTEIDCFSLRTGSGLKSRSGRCKSWARAGSALDEPAGSQFLSIIYDDKGQRQNLLFIPGSLWMCSPGDTKRRAEECTVAIREAVKAATGKDVARVTSKPVVMPVSLSGAVIIGLPLLFVLIVNVWLLFGGLHQIAFLGLPAPETMQLRRFPEPLPLLPMPEPTPVSPTGLVDVAAHPGGPWIARLTNGVTVELLGVSENPSQDRPWWRPDGSPLPSDPMIG